MKKYLLLLYAAGLTFSLQAQLADSNRREIKIQGLVNCRDIGGYPSVDGRHVKWGKLYRSADLSKLTAGGLDTLSRLSIAQIADFRGPFEVLKAPDKLPARAKRISLPAGSEHTGDSNYLRDMMKTAGDSGLVPFYSNISPFRERYKPMFDALLQLNPDSALLFHCTAGKDRTGIAAALLLSALDIDTAKIMEDYLATNYYRRNENEKAIKGMQQFYHLDENTARNLMGAKKAYLEATFNSINKLYGGIDNYLELVMGLDKSKRDRLKEKFLE